MKHTFFPRLFVCTSLIIFLMAPLAPLTHAEPPSQDAPLQTLTFAPDTADFPNPERGFYHQDVPLWLGEERFPQDVAYLREFYEDGNTVMRWYFLIDEFRDRPLNEEVLAYIRQQFDHARTAGVKVIPRFAYNFPLDGDYPYQEPDAPLNLTLEHIAQLTPILQDSADVIAFMELGFVGAWGEWHSSTHGHVDEDTGLTDNARAIITALLTALPPSRMVAMRYPPYKQALYGDAPLTPEQAFSGTPQARMGAHDDCFLASETNWGTYPEAPDARETLKHYLHLDNRYLPQGGETCNSDAEAAPFIGCENALAELTRLRFSVLNEDYEEGVLAGWRDEGCYEAIARRLGYRLRLIAATLPTQLTQRDTLTLDLTLINEGFAAPYNPRLVELLLRSAADGSVYRVDVSAQFDPRFLLPDDGAVTVTFVAGIPQDMPLGDYALLVNLPDPEPRLYGRPEYAIRLANVGVWEGATGFNRIGAIRVVEGPPRVEYSGGDVFGR